MLRANLGLLLYGEVSVVYPKVGQIPSIRSEDIERKGRSDKIMDHQGP